MYDNIEPREEQDAIPELKPHCAKTKEWKPSNQETLREFPITIKFLNRGCVVSVGCKEIAFTNINEAMAEINEYVTGDTWEVQKKWRNILDN
jgi:hypothetical protein